MAQNLPLEWYLENYNQKFQVSKDLLDHVTKTTIDVFFDENPLLTLKNVPKQKVRALFREFEFSESQMIFSWLIPETYREFYKKFKGDLINKLTMVLSYYPSVFYH